MAKEIIDIDTINMKISKIPALLKVAIAIVPSLLVSAYFVFQHYSGLKNSTRFYKESFSSKVVRNEEFEGRSMMYTLDNGLEIFLGLSDSTNLSIGDSVIKPSNTFIFDVYRIDKNDKYQFLNRYNFEETI
jgi:hypothetical protein